MAQLYRHRQGLQMGALSQFLMVTGANVTWLTNELESDGLVSRVGVPGDRRAWIARLTPKGRRVFEAIAGEHEAWILEIFSGMDEQAMRAVYSHLGDLRSKLTCND
ncbi:hypothetical protein FQZ97_1224850 [compost metagenome]